MILPPKIWLIDFEYQEEGGNLPQPWCAVGKELNSGKLREWRHTDPVCRPVYDAGPDSLVVAYGAEAEGRCIRKLGWPKPANMLDLLPVFRRLRNRFGSRSKASLLDALDYFGQPGISILQKEEFRALAIRGAPFTPQEMDGLVAYCKTDVDALELLLPHLLGTMDFRHALLMGRYTMGAIAAVQCEGIPVDHRCLMKIVWHQREIVGRLIAEVDQDYGVYVEGSFSHARFETYLRSEGIAWPQTITGRLQLDEDTFKEQALLHPALARLAELRKSLATFRTIKPSIGSDGRSRVAQMPFCSITGRNQPGGSGNVFAWPKWMRSLIKAPEGRVLISFDFEQQEFVIGAALAGDAQMLAAYHSGDPYLHMAKASRAIPVSATKESHGRQRNLYKTAVLSLQYGVGLDGLALKIGDRAVARQLYEEHLHQFSRYHKWCGQQVDRVLLGETLTTPFGWAIKNAGNGGGDLNPRSAANWTVQATGSDILRIAAISLVERDIPVVALVHDAIVVECDARDVCDMIATVTRLMEESSEVVLLGQRCRVEASVSTPGGGWPHASPMFSRVMSIIKSL